MVSPSVSSSASWARTLASTWASCPRVSSSQNTAGAPVARARPTASSTQLRIGASLVWQARQMSPCRDLVLQQRRCRTESTTRTRAGRGDLEGLVVAAVLLGLLRHQADVGRGAHGRRVERAVLAAERDGLGVERGVGGVRDDELGVLQLAVGVPHLAGRADRRRHRRVDDHVAGHVQVGDAAVGVDHGQRRAAVVGGGDRLLDGLALLRRQLLQRGEHAGQPVVRVGADRGQVLAVAGRTRRRSRRSPRARTGSGRTPSSWWP